MPTATMPKNNASSGALTTFWSMISEGSDSAVTAIIKASATQADALANQRFGNRQVPKISAYIGMPSTVASGTDHQFSWPSSASIQPGGNPVVDGRANADADQYVEPHAGENIADLRPGELRAIAARQLFLRDVEHRVCIDKGFDIALHLRPADQRAAEHRQHQTDQHVGDGNRPLKMLASRITEARSTSGEEIRKAKVTPAAGRSW